MRNRQASYPLRVSESLATSPVPKIRRDRCRASLVLHNPGDERVIVRTAVVRDVDGLRGEAGGVFDVRVPAMLRPASTARVPIGFDIPKTAAPGTYRFEVNIAGVEEVMEVQVPSRLLLRLTPLEILITEPGTSVHVLVAENLGNVAMSVAGNVAVPLDDELIVCRSLRGGLALFDEVEEEEVTFDRFFARAARTAHDALDGAILGIRFTPVNDPIEPGTSTIVTVEIDTPASLDPRTRYVAMVPVLSATLAVVVLPTKVGLAVPASKQQPLSAKSSTKKATARKRTT